MTDEETFFVVYPDFGENPKTPLAKRRDLDLPNG